MSIRSRSTIALFSVVMVFSPDLARAQGSNCTAPTNVYTGSGIPTANSMCGGTGNVNMYLGVSPRYTSPAPTTDGNGNWWAETGDSNGGAQNAGFAKWNFNVATTGATQSDLFKLTITGLGVSPLYLPFLGNFADSQNLKYFDAFGFNNNDSKTYTFRLDQYSASAPQTSLGYVEEVVNVGTVPEPSTYALMAAGLIALGFVSRRRKNGIGIA